VQSVSPEARDAVKMAIDTALPSGGGDAITGLLRIACQRAVLFEQLAGIAPLAIVEPVAVIVTAAHLLRARAIVAAAAPPGLVVSDQLRVPV
jgi:hypothetical protein